ncbi:hypothetical protein [Ruegeria atlantica]|uniref:hypothetical protein n=1 Tax=Ruegeria atlantica TaxID=81569 RepID=UPI002494764E|nr:hypothetical protein [Ruegeria atlantica]
MSADSTLYNFAVEFLRNQDERPNTPDTVPDSNALDVRRAALAGSSEAFAAALSGAAPAEISVAEAEEAAAALRTLYVGSAQDRDTLASLAEHGLSWDRIDGAERVLRSGSDRVVAVRRVPIFSTQLNDALPAWTSGLAAEVVIGPVRDAFGRDIWIHIFRVVRQVRFVRAPGGAPFLSAPHVQFASVFHSAAQVDHDLAGGSFWMATNLFATVAGDTYTGIRIKGGSLSFSSPIAVNGDEVVVPTNVTCKLDILLDPPAQGISGVPLDHAGADARASIFDPPEALQIAIGPGGNQIEATADATIGGFGEEVKLTPAQSAAQYLPEFNRLLVPMTPTETEFTVTASDAKDFAIAGEAPITGGGLALPAARIAPALLGEAAGVGALMLQIDPGLSAQISSETALGQLGLTTLMVDQERLALTALQAEQDGRRTLIEIGDVTPASRAEIGRATQGSVRYFAQTGGQEAVQYVADVSLRPDLPRDVAGDRVPLRLLDAVVIIAQIGDIGALAIYGRNHADQRRCFQIKNGLLRTNDPINALLYGFFDGERINSGALWAGYRLEGIVPTLPDPYAANVGIGDTSEKRGAQLLISRFAVQPGSRTLDFFLPGPAPVAAPNNGDTGASMDLLSNSGAAVASVTDVSIAARPNTAAAAADPSWGKALGDALDFEFVPKITLLDVSSGAGQFGVALRPPRGPRDPIGVSSTAPTAVSQVVAIEDLAFEVDPNWMVLLTLPAVQWEPAVVVPPEPADAIAFPERVVFLNSGVPAVIDLPDGDRVPFAPVPAYDAILDRLRGDTHPSSRARVTLPFGMIASARLTAPTDTERGVRVQETRPEAPDDMQGAHQLSIRARDRTLARRQTPAMPGHTVQLPVAVPADVPGAPVSILGTSATSIFNSSLGAGSPSTALVPVTRLDLSGYGESIFSKWNNPLNATTQVEKVELDVPVGRTAREVVTVKSVLVPYGVPVVRTITLQRKADAIVGRSDTGWVAGGDGLYDFPGLGLITHPGVVSRITNVTEIAETGQIVTANGQDFMAVYFQGDLVMDGADTPVPVKQHLGYVRITADPPAFDVATYTDLINQVGPMCGPVEAVCAVAGGEQKMRMNRVGIAVAGTEFAMTAWGSLVFPGGEWSVLETLDASGAPSPVPEDEGLPLIRRGAAGLPTGEPYRFADPEDLFAVNPAKDYGILHSMGMQRAFFRRPRIEPTEPNRIVSTERPIIADPFVLADSLSMFPEQSDCIPFPNANFALVADGGSFRLDGPGTFNAGIGRRTTASAGSVQSDVDYTNSEVTYEVDTSQPTPWEFGLTNATRIMAHTDMGDVITTVAQVSALGDPDTRFEAPELRMGGPVQIVQDLLTILQELGISGEPDVRMENKWKFTFGMKVPFKTSSGADLQIPPSPLPGDIIFADTGVEVLITLAKEKTKAKFSLGGKPMFAIKAVPGLYAVAIIKFSLIMSVKDGTTFVVTIGFGIAYMKKVGPGDFLKLKGMVGFTFIAIIGETVMGWGGGILLQAEAAIKPIISVAIRFEAMGARLLAQPGTGNETVFFVSKVTVSIDISVFLVLSFSASWDAKMVEITRGPLGKEDAPDVL